MNILEEIKNLLIDKKNSYFLLTTRNNHLGKIYNVFDDLIDFLRINETFVSLYYFPEVSFTVIERILYFIFP